MKVKSRLTVSNEIPTGSMADIAFLLIVFFMVTTTFSARRGIDFRLPEQKPHQENTEDDFAKLEATYIRVDPSGRITVDDTPMNLEEIQGYILAKLEINPKKFVIMQTDREASYGDMVNILDELKQAEVENIVIPSKQDIDDWADMGFF